MKKSFIITDDNKKFINIKKKTFDKITEYSGDLKDIETYLRSEILIKADMCKSSKKEDFIFLQKKYNLDSQNDILGFAKTVIFIVDGTRYKIIENEENGASKALSLYFLN